MSEHPAHRLHSSETSIRLRHSVCNASTYGFGPGLRAVLRNRRSQAASMTLLPGETEGGPDNRHRGSDQWLFVVAGTGLAILNGKRCPLRADSLLLIEHGDTHEIRNTGTPVAGRCAP
jgi:mannose-6-phosphate isomerase-like protein (cupin superfamily)